MSRTYEKFCELMSAHNEADEKWMPIQKAHELLHSVNEDEIWEQRNAAANALYKYIAELEAEQARWVMVSERLPKESGWYLAGLIGWAGGYYTAEVYFDTETGLPWRSSVRDEVYCWLDGVPELPKPPEV